MHGDARTTGEAPRHPEVVVAVRPPSLPAYVARVTLRGEHDLGTSEAIRVSLAPLLGDVLVDLSECDFVDSSVLAVLITKAQDLEREGHSLELLVPPEQTAVARVFEIVQIGQFITVHQRAPGSAASPTDTEGHPVE